VSEQVDTPVTELRIRVRPSLETNDHEVCLLGDGEDLIARFENGFIGLDPDDILVPPSSLVAASEPHVATIGRCDCGYAGCGSVEVTISRDAELVTWRSADSSFAVQFRADAYDREVARAANDFSWETPDRTTARLIAASVDRSALAQRGFTFEWASGRLKEGAMSVSLRYERGPYQLIVSMRIDGPPVEVAERCVAAVVQDPSQWPDVSWYPQQPGLAAPGIAGPGWKKGTT